MWPPFVTIDHVERGALVRAELRIELNHPSAEQIHPMLLDILVERAVARLRVAPALMGSGASIEGGCGATACTMVIEGLANIVTDATSALEDIFPDSTVRFGLFERMQLQQAWKDRLASDDTVLKAAMIRAFSSPDSTERRRLAAAASRPVFGPKQVDTAMKALSCQQSVLIENVSANEIAPPNASCVDPPATVREFQKNSVALTSVLTVGDPSDRVWVAVAWASTGEREDLLRDALIVGDFESLAVQGLREGTEPLTYDVESASGTGWSAAVFQTHAADAKRAADWVSGLVTSVDEVPAEVVRGAYLRLAARHAGTSDSLAGQLADLPEMPPPPVSGISDGVVLGTVLFGGEPADSDSHWTRCQALNGMLCRQAWPTHGLVGDK